MRVPRITIWSPPFEIPIRLVNESLNAHALNYQALAIQSKASARTLIITPGAMFILSSLAGRRIADPIRWFLMDSLDSIIKGELQNKHPERQDLLAPTFGELLGAVLLALALKGTVEIVRLLDSSFGTSPDYLLLQPGESGRIIPHLLECKGTVEDVHNIHDRKQLDICQHIRNLRNIGKPQLDKVDLSVVKPGSRLIARTKKIPFGLSKIVATKNLAVICIPDGRIPSQIRRAGIMFASRKMCVTVDCINCMSSATASRATNLICVLHKESVIPNALLNANLQSFITRYRLGQHATWTNDDEFFIRTFDQLQVELVEQDWSPEVRPALILMAGNLLEEAATQGLRIADMRLDILERLSARDLPDLPDMIPNILSVGAEAPIETVTLQRDQVIDSVRSQQLSPRIKLRLRDSQRFPDELAGLEFNMQGILENEGRTSVLRLTTDQITPDAYEALKEYTKALIDDIRSNLSPKVKWQREYAKLNDNELEFGVSWDQFPYPHPDGKRLGITAWVSVECRAEIIIRRLST